MEEMMLFLQQYGWQLALIAFLGVVLLGVLKYANVFSKIEKEKRKPIYFAISVGFSVAGTVVYLLFKGQLTYDYVLVVSGAIYALNQTFYAIYETTTLKDLFQKLGKWIKGKFVK